MKPGKTKDRVKCPQVGAAHRRLYSSLQGDCDYTSPPFRNLEIEEMIRNYELEVASLARGVSVLSR